MTASDQLKIGIVGCGHWGHNYVRNFWEIDGISLIKCCDSDSSRLTRIGKRFSGVVLCSDYHELLSDKEIKAIIVATPASTHYNIIKESLRYGKDVLAEKPLTLIPEEALELHKLATDNGLILMVAHTFLYNAGIRKLKELIDSGKLGKIYYLNATRTHLGLIRDDVNVIWDLAPHDVSIFNYLLKAVPVSANAVGACHLKKGREDVAFINLVYPENVIANIHVSWEDSNKERTVRVVGSKARAVFDDIDNLEKVRLYEKGISVPEDCDSFGEFQLSLRDGDIISPRVESTEPLRTMCAHFVECVGGRQNPITDSLAGYNVVKVVAAIDRSMKKKALVSVEEP